MLTTLYDNPFLKQGFFRICFQFITMLLFRQRLKLIIPKCLPKAQRWTLLQNVTLVRIYDKKNFFLALKQSRIFARKLYMDSENGGVPLSEFWENPLLII